MVGFRMKSSKMGRLDLDRRNRMSTPHLVRKTDSPTRSGEREAASAPTGHAPKPRSGEKSPTAWRDAFFQAVSPGVVTGITFGAWLRLLAQNRLRIHPSYWPKAGFTTLASGLSSAFSVAEKAIYSRKLAATEVPPPLFILGHWRSGTTHLHNLLAIDKRFGSPKFSEVTIPSTFLTGEWVLNSAARVLLPKTRFGIDNVSLSTEAPSEEEFALAQMTSYSPYMGWAFPEHADYYGRYLNFRGVPAHEVAEWKAAFLIFLKKLTIRHGKPMILKSPPHTARIRLLLDIFPNARFIHIHRDPYTVYQSTRHLHVSSWKNFAFQKLDEDALQERILRQYVDMFDAFFDDRSLIPSGRFTELSFIELEADPMGQVERIYRELSLPDFAEVQPRIEQYVASLAGYKKNKHVDLPAPLRERIQQDWRRTFDEWGYER